VQAVLGVESGFGWTFRTRKNALMNTTDGNKFAMAVLTALLIAFGGKTMFEIRASEPVAKNAKGEKVAGYELPKSTLAAAGAAIASAFDFKQLVGLMGKANADNGQANFKLCAACHTVDKGGQNRVGPNLHGVVGRGLGSVAGFNYSDAVKGKGGNWDWEKLAAYLNDPRGAIPGNKMAFAGIKDMTDLADTLAYLGKLADSPVALPK
jgi:cytochrome c